MACEAFSAYRPVHSEGLVNISAIAQEGSGNILDATDRDRRFSQAPMGIHCCAMMRDEPPLPSRGHRVRPFSLLGPVRSRRWRHSMTIRNGKSR